jgi:hypothetical protein
MTKAEKDRLRTLVESLRRSHSVCDYDPDLSCPLSDGYDNFPRSYDCTCRATETNATVDAILAALR